MSRVFLSHSSVNSAEAIAVRDWMIAGGWDDVFLDLDPERGLKAGERWQDALKRAAERCEMVMFLISPAWASSKWCIAEYLLAKSLNKRVFAVVIEATPFASMPIEMTSEWQVVDLTSGQRDYRAKVTVPPSDAAIDVAFSRDGLHRLSIGLVQAGIDARFFAWPPANDPQRPPYRGLNPLDVDDAGIFFGRDAAVVCALDQLRGLRQGAPGRLFVILGASGSGKSSLLRAGLVPRLTRDSRSHVVLPVIRPERTPLTGDHGLLRALEGACKTSGMPTPRADLRQAIAGGPEALKGTLARLAEQASAAPENRPMLVLAIDQGEELFLAEAQAEARPFMTLLRGLLADDAPAVLVIVTIRSDNYERLQLAGELEGIRQTTLSLPPMPKGSYAEVIKGPARRLEGTPRALKLDEALVDALLADVEADNSKDALPLLSFALERLYGEFHAGSRLELAHYERLGRIKGSIEAAVEQAFAAADKDARIPHDRTARLALLRRGLIPWLAGIDPDTKAPRRRVARLAEIPEPARPLVELLVEQRLLATDVLKTTGDRTIEPAHEALLRHWTQLNRWLEEDAGLLTVLDGVRRASCDWEAAQRAPSWLIHTGQRLALAERLSARPDIAASLQPLDHAYLTASREAETDTRRRRRRVRLAAAAVGALALLGGLGWWQQDRIEKQIHWYAVVSPFVAREVVPFVVDNATEAALAPGATFRECGPATHCAEMVVIPGGAFTMGTSGTERATLNTAFPSTRQSFDAEVPARQVRIRRFAVSKFELTFDQWQVCVAYRGCPSVSDAGWGRGSRPVIHVTWHEARQYMAWWSTLTGKTYRLLTEAEWEYAARAGTTTRFSWGDDVGTNNANCDGCGSKWDGRETAPVGSFAPNPFGLHDMHGNAREWVEDPFHLTYAGSPPADGSAWHEGGDVGQRMMRGGGWFMGHQFGRSANRAKAPPETRLSFLGIRVARELKEK